MLEYDIHRPLFAVGQTVARRAFPLEASAVFEWLTICYHDAYTGRSDMGMRKEVSVDL